MGFWTKIPQVVKTIKSVRPGTKFKGQKTVKEHKADMKFKKAQIKLDQTLTKTEKSLKKAVQTAKDIEKKVKTKHFYAPKDF